MHTKDRDKGPFFYFVWQLQLIHIRFGLTLLLFLMLVMTALGRESRQVVVKFHSDVSVQISPEGRALSNVQSLNQVFANHSITRVERVFSQIEDKRNYNFRNYYLVACRTRSSSEQLISELQEHPMVLWAESNAAYKVHFTPNDSLLSDQWALNKLGMPSAWDIEKGDPDIIVGVIDTGVDYLHQDLQQQLWVNSQEDLNQNGVLDSGDIDEVDNDNNGYVDDVIGWDFTDAPDFPDNGDYLNPDNDPMDEFPGGHGTAVSGIIAATTNNTTGIAGLAPDVRFMALRAGTSSGFLEEDDVAEAIVYAVQNGCRIINMSFGDVVYSHLIKDAVDYGIQQGVIFVASSGNAGDTVLNYPASYDETISVGATVRSDNLASFSSYGSKLDIVAPGHEIVSTEANNHYGALSGTSFSAPMVSAALALIWSLDKNSPPQTVKARLLGGCTDLGAIGWDHFFGHGLLNVQNSLLSNQTGLVEITVPATSSGLRSDTVAIIGTATHSEMQKYSLSFGVGETPHGMNTFYESSEQVFQDTLGFWETSSLPDSVYTLELKITKWDLSSSVHRVVVYLDRTAPVMDSLTTISMMADGYPGYFIEAFTDDQTRATLYYRKIGESTFSRSLSSPYFNDRHYFLLSQKQIFGQVEYYIQLENTSGLVTPIDNNENYFQLNLNRPTELIEDFQTEIEVSGFAYYLPEVRDFNQDGLGDVVTFSAWPGQSEARLSVLNYQNNGLTRHPAPIPAFPRDVFDVDGDSIPELLAGYGGASYLFSGSSLPQFSAQPIQSSQNDFWAARMLNLNDDGHTEILAIQQDEWHIFRLTNPLSFTVELRQTLMNPTAGENKYGVPHAKINDLDNDGWQEIIIGDYDGDIIVYEEDNNGDYTPVYHRRLPGVDATHHFDTGDFDNDGSQELAVATKHIAEYSGESSVGRQYWTLSILESDDDNSLKETWRQNFHGFVEQKNAYSGVTAADYDSDGKDELFFTPYPRAYYIQHRTGDYEINWYYRGINSNAVPKLRTNKFLTSGDSTIVLWNRQTNEDRPLPPQQVWIESADTVHVHLSWNNVTGASGYEIEREDMETQQTRTINSFNEYLIDSLVVPDHLYTYQVRTVDSSFSQVFSSFSSPVNVRAENPPVFQQFTQVSAKQFILEFSKPLGSASFEVDRYLLLPDSLRPNSAIRGKGKRQVLLSFLHPLASGAHHLILYDLRNNHNVPFYRDSLTVQIDIPSTSELPYLKRLEMISKKQLLLYFNHAMDKNSVEQISNYRVTPDDQVVRARLDSVYRNQVHVYLTGKNRMGSLGETYYLEISGLKDVMGQPIEDSWGNRFLIQKVVQNLENVLVYPNPFRKQNGQNEITFGNIPSGCEIFLYTANGEMIKRLEEKDNNGGVSWDLKNNSGHLVQSGVYIFMARYRNEEKSGKFVIIR